MSAVSVYSVIAALSGLLAIVAGRVFAIEGGRRPSSVLAASYVGAGVGLMTSVLIGPLLTLVAQYLNAGSATWFDALDVAGRSLLWGTAAGAAGGLAIGVVVMLLPARWRRRNPN